MPVGIHEEDGYAVRHGHRHECAGSGGDVAVPIGADGKARTRLSMAVDRISMHLPGVSHSGEPKTLGQIQPVGVFFRASTWAEKTEVSFPFTRTPAGGPLYKPGKPLSPFGVCPAYERGARRGRASDSSFRRHRTDPGGRGGASPSRNLRNQSTPIQRLCDLIHGHRLPGLAAQDPGWLGKSE